MFDSEFSDVYERAAASALRDVIAVSPKTFKKSGFDNYIFHCYEEKFTSSLLSSERDVWQGLCGNDTTGDMGCCQPGTASF